MGITIVIVFFILMGIGVPIAFALAGAGLIGLVTTPGMEGMASAAPEQIFSSLNSFPFLTIPLFILAGTLMAEGGVASRLMNVTVLTAGRGRGGLGAATVIAAMFFHGISGSSTADTAAIGKVTLPSLKAQGYPLPFGAALIAAAGATATLIPPTIDLIIIGVIANISIAGLFAGGLIPALINGTGLVAVVVLLSIKNGWGISGTVRPTFRAVLRIILEAIPALMMIVIILGGILGGIFTPTEASSVAVVFGLLISMFIYRELKLSMIPGILREAVEISGMVLLVIAMGAVVAYALTIGQVPIAIAESLNSYASSPWVFLLLVQIVFFVIGMFMDTLPALLILMPILVPIAQAHGIAPIHFGILVEANVALGLATPPVGVCLYAACAVAKLPLESVVRPILPMIAVLAFTMFIITYVEVFTMFLPTYLGLVD